MAHPHPAAPTQTVHYRPVIAVVVRGPLANLLLDGLLDSGSDETVFPASAAVRLGVDLARAATRRVSLAGRPTMTVQYAQVSLRITDGLSETYEWTAVVGFAPMSLPRVLLGSFGFLEFFDFTLRSARREFELLPNPTFPGTQTIVPGR